MTEQTSKSKISSPKSMLKRFKRRAVKEQKITSYSRLGTQNIVKLLIEFSIPALIALVVQNLYNIIDGIFVGHGVGDLGLAATTVAVPTMTIMVALSMLIGVGGNAICAIRLGEGNQHEAERITAQSFMLLVVFALAVSAIGFVLLDPILVLSGATAETMGLAKDFCTILLAGYVLQSVGFGMNNFIRTAGAPNMALFSMVCGTAVNLILCYLFVLQYNWGIKGAGYATVIAWATSCAIVMWFFLSGRSSLKLNFSLIGLDIKLALRILALGLAPAILQLGFGVLTMIENNLLIYWGSQDPLGSDGALAVMGVAARVGMITIVPALAFMQGAQPIVGFNYGAKQYLRVRRTVYAAMIGATLIILIPWLFMMVFPQDVARLFGLADAVAHEAAVSLIYWIVFVPILSVMIIGSNYFEATGQALKSTMLSLTRQFILLIPMLLILPGLLPQYFPITSVETVFFSASISDITSTILVLSFFIPEMRKLRCKQARLEDEGFVVLDTKGEPLQRD